MRFLYMDEAGTSDDREEAVRIVAIVIVHADKQLMLLERVLAEARASVPEEFRASFRFHAEEIMHRKDYRERWRLTDRLNLLNHVMSLPRKAKCAIAYGLVWADAPAHKDPHRFFSRLGLEHQFMAAVHAISRADWWLRERGDLDEIGSIVCERNDIQNVLRDIPKVLKQSPFIFRPGELADTETDKARGYNAQDGQVKVTKIRNAIHFVDKEDDPLLPLADFVAYGLKRYFSEREHGEEFCRSIAGGLINISDFKLGPSSGGLLP